MTLPVLLLLPREMLLLLLVQLDKTGRRVLERLADTTGGSAVIGGVRNVDKATKSLTESSTVLRGAMIQNVGAVDLSDSHVNLKHLDVVMDSVDQLADSMKGANALVIATGFIPGNPLKMSQAAHEVDNIGTCHLIDAAKKAGISKIVMVSWILTNGRNWGQEKESRICRNECIWRCIG
jgi:nucleoside-diphosphate-sugar epimerase